MIYLAHFDFFENNLSPDESHGYFTCSVKAKNIEEALEKFRDLPFSLKENDNILDGIEEIYLDTCIEIRDIPEDGFIANYVNYLEANTARITTSIRGATDDKCIAYGFADDGEGEEVPSIRFTENNDA